jgi:hypothetical protein
VQPHIPLLPNEEEYSKLLVDLGSIDRLENIVADLEFDAFLTRVQNPSEIYAIPNIYKMHKIEEKMKKFLKLHKELKVLEACKFVEVGKTYVIHTSTTYTRACAVS